MGKKWVTPSLLWRRLKPVTRKLRNEPTPAEGALWNELRSRKLDGIRFRRQHPLGRFVVDFYAPESRLVIEIDGPIHLKQKEADRQRDLYLNSLGIRVLRLSNDATLEDMEGVLSAVRSTLAEGPPPCDY